MPTQGGISERFFVWSWEVMHCLRPMIRLGYFKQVRRVLEYLLALQNRPECAPNGEYTALEGAIGDTANGWANGTGAVLLLAADYVRYSQDDDFIGKYKTRLDLAAKWLVRVISATRIPGAFNHGLFPKANSTDGDREICLYAFTDSWNCAGLSEYAKYVNPEFEPEAVQYRLDLDAAISHNVYENGDIARSLEGKAFHGFSIISGALNFLDAGNVGSDDSRLINYVKYLESKHFNGFFCSPMSYDVNYVGNSESIVFSYWLKRGEFKKAWTAWMTLRRFAMTRYLYLTQERCSNVDPAFTPWQPNASNNGRILKTMIGRLYLEDGNRIILFGGLAPFELEKRKRISIRGLHTEFGILDFHYSADKLSLCWNKPVATDIRFVLPEYCADKIRISVSE